MLRIRQTLQRPWALPFVSGLLITASLLLSRMSTTEAASDPLMIAAAVVAGTPILLKAISALRYRIIGIDLLVSIAAVGAIVIGEYWESAAVTFLFAIGGALEARTLTRTRAALSDLISEAPQYATVLRDGAQMDVPASEVVVGEIVIVKNGGKVPVDGVVTAGFGSIDESSITGEPIPAEKDEGGLVYAGTISKGGVLQVQATQIGEDTTLARIIHRVEEAQDAQAPTARFMDRFSSWYTPGIIMAATLVGVFTGDIEMALTLLVISCPGALVISIPVAVVAGIGGGAREGILIKGGEHLEVAAKVNAVALDKTGTLTEGHPELQEVLPLAADTSSVDVLRVAALAEAGSEHPLARPILRAAASAGVEPEWVAEEIFSVPGKGIAATARGDRILVGNTALMAEYDLNGTAEAERAASELAARGQTPMLVASGDTITGVVAVADKVRPEAPGMVAGLKREGVHEITILTGDVEPVAVDVARQVGITKVRAGLLPEEKLEAVSRLQQGGYTVAMVGDGVNDAPALAAANVGVAMGAAGSAVAIETADIALMGDDLRKLPRALALAKRTVRIMRQNIAVALGTVAVLIVGVLSGWVDMAGGMLVHEASVLIVIANAMRLMRIPHSDRKQEAAIKAQVVPVR